MSRAPLYPRPNRARDKSHRRWRVEYDLLYDGGDQQWLGFYRTKAGACIAAWWHRIFSSWGGSAYLTDQRPERPREGE